MNKKLSQDIDFENPGSRNFSQDIDFENHCMNIIQSQGVINNSFFNIANNQKLSYSSLGHFVVNFYHITEIFVNNLENLIKNIDSSNDTTHFKIINNFRDTIEKIRKDEFAEFSKNPSVDEFHHNLLRRMATRLGFKETDKERYILNSTSNVSKYIKTAFTEQDLTKSLAVIFVIETMAATMFTALKKQCDGMKDGSIPFFTKYERKRVDLHYKLENEEHIGESHELLDCLTDIGKISVEKHIASFSKIIGEYRKSQSNNNLSFRKRHQIEFINIISTRDVGVKISGLPF